MEKDIEQILITSEQLQERISQLAAEVSAEYAGKKPIFIGVLKGVLMFMGDFVKQVNEPCEIDLMRIASYRGTGSKGSVDPVMDISTDIRGRHVVILEDIFDTGRSLTYVCNHLQAMEPASIKIVTLLDKPAKRLPEVTIKADYIGFTVPDEFVVGYGLDYNELYRNLPYIGILSPEVYQ